MPVAKHLGGFKTAKLFPAASPVAKESHRRLAKMPAQVNLEHRCQLLQVAAGILAVEFNRAKSQRVGFVRPEEHMVQVFEQITAVELLRLSVGELANRFGCSRRHLNRLFHHFFGISVAALRMEMRLLRSVTLLRDPDAKVIRVAEDCGFNHLGLFNICFKRRFGASPGEWRKRAMKSGGRPGQRDAEAAACPLQINGVCPSVRQLPSCGRGRALRSPPDGEKTGTGKAAGERRGFKPERENGAADVACPAKNPRRRARTGPRPPQRLNDHVRLLPTPATWREAGIYSPALRAAVGWRGAAWRWWLFPVTGLAAISLA